MNQEAAAVVVATLASGFHMETLEPETVDLWTAELVTLEDFEIAYSVARGLVRNTGRFPSLKLFREAYMAESRHAADERARAKGLPEPSRANTIPEWVKVWSWMRANGDFRALPQQGEHVAKADQISKADYEKLLGEWAAAGSPTVGVATAIAAAGDEPAPALGDLLGEHPETAVTSHA